MLPVPGLTIRPAFPSWSRYDERLRDVVSALTADQLAIRPAPDRWPLWASIGHLACQRVYWLCDVAGEPGASSTRFTDASFDCPGDDDLEHVLSSVELVEALDATFRIVAGCLDRWTLGRLEDEVRHPAWPESSGHTRGFIIERVFAHDIAHCTELNETLGRAGLAQVDLWD
jgi:hypothetical protein